MPTTQTAQLLLNYPGYTERTKPFVKWAGGKAQLLPEIRTRLPNNFKRYIEPFLGGGSVFFDVVPKKAILSDSNDELINCYKVVRDFPNELYKHVNKIKISKDKFYRLRALSPNALSEVDRAARFIFLNKTCYNGLYRVNKKGQFNVPFGDPKMTLVVSHETIEKASRALRNATILAEDYLDILMKKATKGDFVYLDPPYLPIGKFSDFKRYTKAFFYKEDHDRLAELCHTLNKRGCMFMLSNSYHPHVLSLYSKFKIEQVKANRFINCRGGGRGKINELIIRNY